jgi:hypothetical protein
MSPSSACSQLQSRSTHCTSIDEAGSKVTSTMGSGGGSARGPR